MLQDGFDDLPILDGTDDPHGSPAFWADERIDLIDFLKQPGPAFPARRRGFVGFDDVRDGTVFGKLLSLPPGDVAVPPVISNHLLPPVWDMRAHRREPLLGVEDLPVFAVLRRIDDGSFISEILHPLLGKGCPRVPFRVDDVPRQIFNRFLFFQLDAIPAEDMESGMPPSGKHGDHFSRDLSPSDQHAKDLMPEYGLQFFQFQRRGYPEHALAIKAAVCDQDVAVRVEAEKIAEGLDGDDCVWNGILFVSDPLKKVFQRFPGAAAQVMQKFSIIEKVPAQDLRKAEDKMPVGNPFQHVRT